MTNEDYKVLLSLVKDFAKEDAEDILHDALVVALTHQCVDFNAYVMRVAWHLWKQKGKGGEVTFEDVDVAEENEEQNVVEDVYKAIDATGCSWWEKEYFKRKVLEGKTNAEMSVEVGIPVSQCRYTYLKVRRKIRQVLKDGRR